VRRHDAVHGEQYETPAGRSLRGEIHFAPLDLVVALGEPAVEFVLRERAMFPGRRCCSG
jgi:hypothetical protein